MRRNAPRLYLWAAVITWLALIFLLSAQPASDSSSLSGGLIRALMAAAMPGFETMSAPLQVYYIESFQHVTRKTAHLLVYSGLGAFVMLAVSQYEIQSVRRFLYSAALCVLFSILDEFHQLFVPGRSAEILDVVIDTAGALIGILIAGLLIRRKR